MTDPITTVLIIMMKGITPVTTADNVSDSSGIGSIPTTLGVPKYHEVCKRWQTSVTTVTNVAEKLMV